MEIKALNEVAESYLKPSVEVIEVVVETGFEGSKDAGGTVPDMGWDD